MEPGVAALAIVAALAFGLAAGVLIARGAMRARTTIGAEQIEPANGRSSPPADELDLEDQIELGVLRLDAQRNVTSVNRAALRLLRLAEDLEYPRSLMETFLDHRIEEQVDVAARTGSASLELTPSGPDERRMAIRIRRAPGDGMWMLIEDVTELRRLQRIRSEFIDNLSHELRTPLTTIRLLTETLQGDLEQADVPPRIRERIGKIDVETGHLVQMVNELLDLSRIEGGAAELHFEVVDMTRVVEGAVDRLRTFAERQGVTLSVQPTNGVAEVRGDQERLGQVLLNLLHNAVKFSAQGSTVTVAVSRVEEMLSIEVHDQGVGIPRAEVGRVFERFYKVDRARVRGQGGTGLGLAIARHIIEGHGGRIWVESQEGSGSTFIFTVPLAE